MKKKSTKKKGLKPILLIGMLVIALLLGGVALGLYVAFSPNVAYEGENTKYLMIPDRDYNAVLDSLEAKKVIPDMWKFRLMTKVCEYPDHVVPGRYELKRGENSLTLVRRLKFARQTPVRLSFNNVRTKKDLAERVSKKLMMTSDELYSALSNPEIYNKYGTDNANIVSLFIPNTYEVYWNITPEDLIDRMKKEYDKFWTEARQAKLAEVGLTQQEVSTLASIVEEETLKKDEKPRVAGLYLNRVHQGIPLQADPTVKFALQDFSLKRIYKGHLECDSPYNTYKYAGLPPGPIRVPSIESIDAVLNFENHKYIYMCAKEDFSGYHNFAVSYDDHQENANKYRKALNSRGIK